MAKTKASSTTRSTPTPAVNMAELITGSSRFVGALFNIAEADRKMDGPVMSGSAGINSLRVSVSAFLKTPEGKKPYLSLSIGEKDGVHFYGKLFRVEGRTTANGPHYSGHIKVLACDGETDYSEDQWDSAPVLQVCAWRERNADGTARIALYVAPRQVEESELPL